MNLTFEGDPQRNQQQFLVLEDREPFEILSVEFRGKDQPSSSQKVNGSLDVTQRVPLFQDALRRLQLGNVEAAITVRRLGKTSLLTYSCLVQKCRKPGTLKMVFAGE